MLLCAFLLFYFSNDDSVLLGSLIGMALFALPVINNLSPLCAFLLSLPFLLIYLTRFSFLLLFHIKTCLLSGQFSINAWEGGDGIWISKLVAMMMNGRNLLKVHTNCLMKVYPERLPEQHKHIYLFSSCNPPFYYLIFFFFLFFCQFVHQVHQLLLVQILLIIPCTFFWRQNLLVSSLNFDFNVYDSVGSLNTPTICV